MPMDPAELMGGKARPSLEAPTWAKPRRPSSSGLFRDPSGLTPVSSSRGKAGSRTHSYPQNARCDKGLIQLLLLLINMPQVLNVNFFKL